MIATSNIDELNKIIRNFLIEQSGLNGHRVRNALSLYGEDLVKLLSEEIYVSYANTDVVLLFELKSRQSSSNVSMTINEDVLYYKSYELAIIIYGFTAEIVAAKLIARFRTANIREKLQLLGIYVEEVTDSITLNEYVNNTMWLRSDFSINVSCKFVIEQINNDFYIETLNKIQLVDTYNEYAYFDRYGLEYSFDYGKFGTSAIDFAVFNSSDYDKLFNYGEFGY